MILRLAEQVLRESADVKLVEESGHLERLLRKKEKHSVRRQKRWRQYHWRTGSREIRDPKIECMSRDEMADLQSRRLDRRGQQGV